jgi:hypothetical protein
MGIIVFIDLIFAFFKRIATFFIVLIGTGRIKGKLTGMTLDEFKDSLKASSPPQNISTLSEALWHDGKGDWETAHSLAQDVKSHEGSWVHAYLHRKEGDESNAAYWYRLANRKMPRYPLDEEWEEIVTELLHDR